MLQPSTYLEMDIAAGAGPYKHGRRLSGICSSRAPMIKPGRRSRVGQSLKSNVG